MRIWASCCKFENRYVYIFGGNTENDQIEVLDVFMENEAVKCDLINLNINDSIPYMPQSGSTSNK